MGTLKKMNYIGKLKIMYWKEEEIPRTVDLESLKEWLLMINIQLQCLLNSAYRLHEFPKEHSRMIGEKLSLKTFRLGQDEYIQYPGRRSEE